MAFFACVGRVSETARGPIAESISLGLTILSTSGNRAWPVPRGGGWRGDLASGERSGCVRAGDSGDAYEVYRCSAESPCRVKRGLYAQRSARVWAPVWGCYFFLGVARGGAFLASAHGVYGDGGGIEYAAMYQYRHGDPQVAATLEQALVKKAEEGTIMWTAEQWGYDKASVPVSEWRTQTADLEKRLVAVTPVLFQANCQEGEEGRKIGGGPPEENPPAGLYGIGFEFGVVLGCRRDEKDYCRGGSSGLRRGSPAVVGECCCFKRGTPERRGISRGDSPSRDEIARWHFLSRGGAWGRGGVKRAKNFLGRRGGPGPRGSGGISKRRHFLRNPSLTRGWREATWGGGVRDRVCAFRDVVGAEAPISTDESEDYAKSVRSDPSRFPQKRGEPAGGLTPDMVTRSQTRTQAESFSEVVTDTPRDWIIHLVQSSSATWDRFPGVAGGSAHLVAPITNLSRFN